MPAWPTPRPGSDGRRSSRWPAGPSTRPAAHPRSDRSVPTDTASLVTRVLRMMNEDRPHLRPVINATGILLNTGLGRAPLAAEAAEAVAQVARGYCNLELDLASGERGRPHDGGRAHAPPADRGRGRDGRQQQCRRDRADPSGLGGRPRGRRLAWPAHRDRRQLPPAGDLRGLGHETPRGRHDEQDPARRLRPRDRPGDGRAAAGPSEQLPDRRLHRVGRYRRSCASSPTRTAWSPSTTSAPVSCGRGCRRTWATSRRWPPRSPTESMSCSARETSSWAALNAA